ncbi:MAG: TetR/AcrR family transcriptional regulator [Chloroflexota bacterium]
MQRADIVQAAAQIFRRKGYHAASMQDIANAVGLQKASLYHHFASKQDILLEILDQALDLLIRDMQAIVDADRSPETKLRQALASYIDRVTHQADLAAVLQLEHRSLEPRKRARHITRRDRYDALWRTLIRQGIEAGVFRRADETIVAFALLGVQNWMITWFRPDGRLKPNEIAEQFADLMLNGLLVEKAARSR